MRLFPSRREQSSYTSTPRRRYRFHLGIVLIAACVIGAFLYRASFMPDPEDAFCPPDDRLAMATPDGLFEPGAACGPADVVKEDTVAPGDTITALLGRHIDPDEIKRLSRESREFRFSRIQAGQPYRITTRDGEFVSFEYVISPLERLIIRAERGEYLVSVDAEPQVFRCEVAGGTIDQNLFAAVKDAGEDPDLAVALADIFAWDIDFCKDLRKGDSFKVVVEKRYAGDAFTGYGRILAAEFTNQGKTSRAFYFAEKKNQGGYFDEKGQAQRKAFLRAPLSFRRISSGFTHSRLHPILHVRRPHLGVDYAAPAGTPVWSVGDGVVTEKGYNHAAGNFVTIRHNTTYTTRYNHLSRFAKAMAKGKSVRQGEVIGYVGSTGYATGPHLDFRMYKNGQAINVLANPKITADPMPPAKMAAFKARMEPLLAMMRDHGAKKTVAASQPGPRSDIFAAPVPADLFATTVVPLPPTSPTASAPAGAPPAKLSPAG